MRKKVIAIALVLSSLALIIGGVGYTTSTNYQNTSAFSQNATWKVEDLLLIKKHVLKTITFTEMQLIAGDANGDGVTDVEDQLLINKIVNKIEPNG